MKTLDQILEALPEERREQIATRSEELILEEHALRRMRKARKLTQERMAELLGVRQDSISRLERRSDLLLSTLRSYVEAMGGSLQLTVKFPDEQPVAVPSLLDIEERVPVSRSYFFETYWDLPSLVDWSRADIQATANSNAACDAVARVIQVGCPNRARIDAVIDAHAAFGAMLIYRYNPPHQCTGRGWEVSNPQSEPADSCW